MLEGSEAFHPECVRNLTHSVANKRQREIQRLEIELERKTREAANHERQAVTARIAAQKAESDVRIAEREADRLRGELRDALHQASHGQTAIDGLTDRLAQANAAVLRFENELALARRQIQTLQAQAMTNAKDQLPAGDQAKDGRDPAEIRASLLELD